MEPQVRTLKPGRRPATNGSPTVTISPTGQDSGVTARKSGETKETPPGPSTAVLVENLLAIREAMLLAVDMRQDVLHKVHHDQRVSAANLMHYVALRQHDVRSIQDELTGRGLSSLGRCESHAVSNIDTVLDVLSNVTDHAFPMRSPSGPVVDYAEGARLLSRNSECLFGDRPENRTASIMVTMPATAAEDLGFVCDLLNAGLNIARINCAHDDPATWGAIIQNLRKAETITGLKCRVLMDIGGPKLRTGPIGGPNPVVKWRPKRDTYGRVISPARIWLTQVNGPPPPIPTDAAIPIKARWFKTLKPGHEIRFKDCRGRRRKLNIVDCTEDGVWAECDRTAYVVKGIKLQHRDPELRAAEKKKHKGKKSKDKKGAKRKTDRGKIGTLPPGESRIVLYRGDHLVVTGDLQKGSTAAYDNRGQLLRVARIGCTLPEVFADVRRGERILFDDGRIGGVIEEVHDAHLVVKITRARDSGERLAADKGINLPDSALRLDALTKKDREDLTFISEHADLLGYSFVRNPRDIDQLHSALRELGRPDLGIVLKIENRQAFENLPVILLQAMQAKCVGVMIARGDLAVELGYERLAEVQEEILWICEAAHAPVVWATQVLENLAKDGMPTRAEITDAAMGVRTECVMLNKGPFILQTVRTLGNILSRMGEHQSKKRSTMGRLQLANALPTETKREASETVSADSPALANT